MTRQRTGPTPERLALAEQVRQLRHEGVPFRKIQARLGISHAYASELMSDPLGIKTCARKDSYRGICEKCGGPTSGSNGPNNTPDLCGACTTQKVHDERTWTPEVIIERIQTWADIYGKPPLSSDWLIAGEGSRGRGVPNARVWPPTSVVLREFGKWAEAIEQAGFPRPKMGHKTVKWGTGGSHMAREYIVLHQNGNGMYETQRVEAHNPETAIEQAAQAEGTYVAVLATAWVEAEVKTVTKLAAVRA